MPLYLITGLPGTGKSTVNAELKARGFESFDGDEDHLAHWYDDETGKAIDKEAESRTPEFLQTHSRDIPRDVVRRLASRAIDSPMFLCGDPENETELHDLFTCCFALVLKDEAIREERLLKRENNDWGKLPHERAYDLEQGVRAEERYQQLGYIIIDAAQTTATITNQILDFVNRGAFLRTL